MSDQIAVPTGTELDADLGEDDEPEIVEAAPKGAKKKDVVVRVTTIPGDDAFVGPYLNAPELAALGSMLRERHRMPTEISIKYAWKKKGGKRNGLAIFGMCTKTGGLSKHFSTCDFVIWLAADNCRNALFGPEQLEALMFHELQHAGADEESLQPVLIPHEFEGFRADLTTYGLWQPAYRAASHAFETGKQLKLL